MPSLEEFVGINVGFERVLMMPPIAVLRGG